LGLCTKPKLGFSPFEIENENEIDSVQFYASVDSIPIPISISMLLSPFSNLTWAMCITA
jgi:hypothetical protein